MTEPHHDRLDDLLDQAEDGMSRALRRIRELLREDPDEPHDLEHEAFGIETPEERAKREAEERRIETPSPVRPVPPGRIDWRELFRRNWPEGPRRRRK